MRKYQEGRARKVKEIICNCCGRALTFADEIPTEEACHIEVQWGYFSRKDGENHTIDLCEECYDNMVRNFAIPPEVESRTEIF